MSAPGLRERAAAVADAPAARLLAIGLILAAAAATTLVVVLAARPNSTARMLDDPLTVTRSLSTSAALFGDPVQAEVAVYSDNGRIAGRSVRVSAAFAPYRVAATRVERELQGGVTLLRTRFSLECLTLNCLPPPGRSRAIRFPPVAVTYRSEGQDRKILAPWEPLQVSSRLTAVPRASVGMVDSAPRLDPRFERSPTALRALFIVIAVVLGLVGTTLVVAALWPSSYLTRRRGRRLSPLERSLQHVEAAAEGDEAVRRQTLDDLAVHLAEIPSPALAVQTRALAWGQSPPDSEALTSLAQHVRAALNGGGKA